MAIVARQPGCQHLFSRRIAEKKLSIIAFRAPNLDSDGTCCIGRGLDSSLRLQVAPESRHGAGRERLRTAGRIGPRERWPSHSFLDRRIVPSAVSVRMLGIIERVFESMGSSHAHGLRFKREREPRSIMAGNGMTLFGNRIGRARSSSEEMQHYLRRAGQKTKAASPETKGLDGQNATIQGFCNRLERLAEGFGSGGRGIRIRGINVGQR
jgi:hypothetical protein